MNRTGLLLIIFCVYTNVLAQSGIADQWQQKLTAYYKNKSPVKLHLSFNQPSYAPGDTAYFRAAFLMASNNNPVVGEQIITVELVDETNQLQLRHEFKMKNGWTGNQLIIPSDLKPGIFRLVAYNDWMKNFYQPPFFQTFLEVVGPFKQSYSIQKTELKCFAEGGNLVAGHQNKLVVSGPKSETIKVQDSHENLITQLVTDSTGFASFYFTPAIAENYTLHSTNEVLPIPVSDEGISVLFTPTKSLQGQHRLLLQAKGTAFRNQDLVFIVSRHDVIYYSATFRFGQQESISLTINPALLPDGVCYLSINSSTGETYASRIFLNKKSSSLTPSITLSCDTISTRQLLNMQVALSDKQGEPLLARLSISVYRLNSFNDSFYHHSTLPSYLLVSSDLQLDGQDWLVDGMDEPSRLDQLLVTQTWPWYTWKEIIQTPVGRPKYDLRDYPVLSGRLIDRNTKTPLKQAASITFYFSRAGKPYTTFTNTDGEFEAFFIFDFFNKEEVYYRIEREGQKLNTATIELRQNLMNYPVLKLTSVAADSSKYFSYQKKSSDYTSNYQLFYEQQMPPLAATNPNSVLETLVYGPDVEIDLDDYLLFPTMKETLTEIVPFLHNTKIGGKPSIYLYRPDNPKAINQPPLMIIDGVVTDDYEYFLSMNPIQVDKIKLVQSAQKLDRLGGLGKHGFILVETKLKADDKAQLQKKDYLFVNGLNREITFPEKPFQWQITNEHSPRFRSALIWKPMELLDDQGRASFSINSTDDLGTYIIRIEGLSTTGIPFAAERKFFVQF